MFSSGGFKFGSRGYQVSKERQKSDWKRHDKGSLQLHLAERFAFICVINVLIRM
jgi:hypothetical protein